MSELYTYQVARIRYRENSLLSRQDLDTLMNARDYEECLRLLFDKGFGSGSEKNTEEILSFENQKLWDYIKELLKDLTPLNVLFYQTDYNNLKAAIKSVVTDTPTIGVYSEGGSLNCEFIETAVKETNFTALPKHMQKVAEEAYKTLLQTSDGQVCDMMLDKACLNAMLSSAKSSEDETVKSYVALRCALSDIKIAVRCQKTKKSLSFINDSLVACENIDIKALSTAAAKSEEDLMNYLSLTKYSDCVEHLKEGNLSFEKWCDNKLMALIKKQKVNPFTIGPILAYVVARQNEISAIKIVLSGKLNGLDDEMIRERLRDLYV